MKNKNKSKGFTLVELLAVIVIVGILSTIGIVSVSRLINKAKSESNEASQKSIEMAARTYAQENTKIMPKQIGSSVIVKASDLKTNKYITDEITNSDGESCMKNSYVKIYKRSKSEYTYTPYIYCGEEVPDEVEKNKPIATVEYSDNKDVSIAKFVLKMYGDDTKKADGTYDPKLEIDGYSFTISAAYGSQTTMQEVYNSGSISGYGKSYIEITKKLSDYIDLSGITKFSVTATVINSAGEKGYTEKKEVDASSGEVFEDTVPPLCVYLVDGRYAKGEPEEDEWLNKKSTSLRSRKIIVGCDDGDGSGCKNTQVTRTWDKVSAEYAIIDIYDNKDEILKGNKVTGNKGIDTRDDLGNIGQTGCKVRVNADFENPKTTSIVANPINSDGSTNKNKNVLKNAAKLDDSNPSAKITAKDFANVVGDDTHLYWMNASNYPGGVRFTIKVKDNLHLYKYEWKTNLSGITPEGELHQSIASTSNPDGKEEYFAQPQITSSTLNGTTEGEIVVSLTAEGRRYGELIIYDKAGNTVTYEIYANIDRTAPSEPTYYSVKNIAQDNNYTFDTWSNDKTGIRLTANNNSGLDSMSGKKEFQFKKNSNSDFTPGNKFDITEQGIFNVTMRSCDYAGNCSGAIAENVVKHDSVKPTCNVTATTSNSKKYDGEWLKIGESVTLTATCSDETSGCSINEAERTFYTTYNSDIDKVVGAKSETVAGTVKDQAGNVSENCQTYQVKIDHTAPICTTTGGTSSYVNTAVTITGTCSDPTKNGVKSDCVANIANTYQPKDGVVEIISNASPKNNTNDGRVYDKAGNASELCPDTTISFDKKAPEVTCKITKNNINITEVKEDLGYTTKYQYTKSDSIPESGYKTTNSPGEKCGTRYYGYVEVIDDLGNTTRKNCGNYKTDTCCSESNPKGCNWVTACRRGMTETYLPKGSSNGVVCHQNVPASFWGGGKPCLGSTHLYLTDDNKVGNGEWTQVTFKGTSGSRDSTGGKWVTKYIRTKCINKSGQLNKVCQYSTCPG